MKKYTTYLELFSHAYLRTALNGLAAQFGIPLSIIECSGQQTNILRLSQRKNKLIAPNYQNCASLALVIEIAEKDEEALKHLAKQSNQNSNQNGNKPGNKPHNIDLKQIFNHALSYGSEIIQFITRESNPLQSVLVAPGLIKIIPRLLPASTSFSMITAHVQGDGGQAFSLSLLVDTNTRDVIEEASSKSALNRTLQTIVEGAYQPQPKRVEPQQRSADERILMSEQANLVWRQTFFVLNTMPLLSRVFGQPAFCQSMLVPENALPDDGLAIRLANDNQHLVIIVGAASQKTLLSLSKHPQDAFIRNFFRLIFSQTLAMWQSKWTKAKSMPVNKRLVSQILGYEQVQIINHRLRLSEGFIEWFALIQPELDGELQNISYRQARVSLPTQADAKPSLPPPLEWMTNGIPLKTCFGDYSVSQFRLLVKALEELSVGLGTLQYFYEQLPFVSGKNMLEALPLSAEERLKSGQKLYGEPQHCNQELLLALRKIAQRKDLDWLGEPLLLWLRQRSEFECALLDNLIERHFPLRHLVYGLQRPMVSKMLYTIPTTTIVDALTIAPFLVLDQFRRAASPGFAVRLLEDIAHRRPRIAPSQSIIAQLDLYRHFVTGIHNGDYWLREPFLSSLEKLFQQLEDNSLDDIFIG